MSVQSSNGQLNSWSLRQRAFHYMWYGWRCVCLECVNVCVQVDNCLHDNRTHCFREKKSIFSTLHHRPTRNTTKQRWWWWRLRRRGRRRRVLSTDVAQKKSVSIGSETTVLFSESELSWSGKTQEHYLLVWMGLGWGQRAATNIRVDIRTISCNRKTIPVLNQVWALLLSVTLAGIRSVAPCHDNLCLESAWSFVSSTNPFFSFRFDFSRRMRNLTKQLKAKRDTTKH